LGGAYHRQEEEAYLEAYRHQEVGGVEAFHHQEEVSYQEGVQLQVTYSLE
jgi:hypothetical protein